jgi:hypothetical protein
MSNLSWKTSAKGNPYIKDGNYLITVFESKREPGYCYCISNDEEAIKVFSKGTYGSKVEAMAAATTAYEDYQEVPEPEDDVPY